MKRVLEVNVDDKDFGGVFAFVMNVINNIDHKKFILDIAAFEPFEKKEHLEKVRSYGGEVYECYSSGNFIIKQCNTCYKFYKLIKHQHYTVMHVHSDVAYKLLLYGLIGRFAGVGNIIVHSHSSGVEGRLRWLKRILQKIAKLILSRKSFTKLACSKLAVEWMYTDKVNKEVEIITNGINLEKFYYDFQKKNEVRKSLGIKPTEKVIGTVARFSFQKYPEKLLRVFYEIIKKDDNYRLLWVGEGPLRDEIVNEAQRLGVANKIIFYGVSDEIYNLYQAMDAFVMTSRFEGLGIVVLEAQAAGVPCVCSSVIPQEVVCTDDYFPLSLEKNDIEWADKIITVSGIKKKIMDKNERLRRYDIKYTMDMLEKYYAK